MIKWTNEVLQGPPIYNIIGTGGFNGVQFRLANEIKQPGTPFSAENMGQILQKSQTGRFFYYDGEDTVVSDFPAALNGLRRGILLAMAHSGSRLSAEGVVYLVGNGSTQMIENPDNRRVVRDCAVYCRLGEEVAGWICN